MVANQRGKPLVSRAAHQYSYFFWSQTRQREDGL
jgi:hypothetical protein